jgi:hypothetical protein
VPTPHNIPHPPLLSRANDSHPTGLRKSRKSIFYLGKMHVVITRDIHPVRAFLHKNRPISVEGPNVT